MESYYRESIVNGVDCDEIVAEEIENILSCVSKGISDVWLSTIDIPVAVEIAMLKIKKVTAWSVLQHDGVLLESTPLEVLTPDEEPSRVNIDPWSRGTGMWQQI